MPSWLRSWANFSLLYLDPHRNAWAISLHLLGQSDTFLARETLSEGEAVAKLFIQPIESYGQVESTRHV
jgi:hypothetical protein